MLKYLNLIRFFNPTGWLILYCNCLLGLTVAGLFEGLPHSILFLQFLVGAFISRSAGCVINDILDKNFDTKVERTKNRPLASGELSLKQAIIMLIILLNLGLLLLFTLPFTVFIICLIALPCIFLYPLFKRFTNLPQFFLGITYGIAIFASFFAVYNKFDEMALKIIPLYLAIIVWTIIFDTIYAMQDVKDDIKIGVKSTAILFGGKYKKILQLFNIVYLLFLLIFWHIMNLKFVIFPILSFSLLAFLIQKSGGENFFKIFKCNIFVALILIFGILLNYL